MTNVVFPLVGLSYLSLLVFYLPADSREKITLCVSLLTSQLMFLLLMIDNIPVTSLAVPLLGKVILFNLFIIFFSIVCSTIVLSIYYRKPSTHELPQWVKKLRNNVLLIRVLCMEGAIKRIQQCPASCAFLPKSKRKEEVAQLCCESLKELSGMGNGKFPGNVEKAIQNVCFVREYMSYQQEVTRVINQITNGKFFYYILCLFVYCTKLCFSFKTFQDCEHWKFLAAVMDRIFLFLFNCIFVIGMSIILKDAPALFDHSKTINTSF